MGFMPSSLFKGTIGLRLDYLSRLPSVRQDVKTRLQAGENPFDVVKDIHAHGIKIDVLNDDKALFIQKLNYLNERDPDSSPDRGGRAYYKSDSHLHLRNQDSSGNRDAFMQYWLHNADITLIDVMRTELLKALNSEHQRIEFYWDCSLPDHSTPTVKTIDIPHVAFVLFRTDEAPDEKDPDLPKRDPDEDPADHELDEVYKP